MWLAGRLVRLCEGPAIPAHVVFTPDRARDGTVRALVDALEPSLRAVLRPVTPAA